MPGRPAQCRQIVAAGRARAVGDVSGGQGLGLRPDQPAQRRQTVAAGSAHAVGLASEVHDSGSMSGRPAQRQKLSLLAAFMRVRSVSGVLALGLRPGRPARRQLSSLLAALTRRGRCVSRHKGPDCSYDASYGAAAEARDGWHEPGSLPKTLLSAGNLCCWQRYQVQNL